MSSAKKDLTAITGKIEAAIKGAVKQKSLQPMAEEAIRLIVKRTRLGFGVTEDGTERAKLAALSSAWIAKRGQHSDLLSQMTTVGRSNLTFTGQMLDSMQVISIGPGKVVIGPKGYRNDPLSKGISNEQVANYVAKAGRPFNNISRLELSQLTRFYRRLFGDLLRNERLEALTRD